MRNDSRDLCVHMARVFLAQCRHVRRHNAWHATLLVWAAERRRRAAACGCAQGDLFARELERAAA
jgi:hypothetical protein